MCKQGGQATATGPVQAIDKMPPRLAPEGPGPRGFVHIILFLLCTGLLIAACRACLRATSLRPELILISLVSIYLAYPVKNLALAYLKYDFMTFYFYNVASPLIYVQFLVFAVIAWRMLLRVPAAVTEPGAGAAPSLEPAADAARPPRNAQSAVALTLLVVNTLFLFWSVYQVTGAQLASLLLTSDARKAFLLSQQGQGWISLLLFFTFPLIAMQPRRAIRNPVVLACIAITMISLAVVGSRLLLFGYVICLVINFYRLTPVVAAILFFGFVLFGALIYIGFGGENSQASVYDGLVAFMRTFDGADLMNGYLESPRQLYYGVTIVQEVLVTYIPRVLWASKPYNFGGIVITGDMYPELQDVQSLGATFPPGFFLEGLANFWLLVPLFYYAVMKFLIAFSQRMRLTNIYLYALYISGAAIAATFFRGFGSFIVALTGFSIILVAAYLLSLPFGGARPTASS